MASFKNWVVAARLRTLPLAISGVIVGASMAAQYASINLGILSLTFLTAILLQIVSNYANDYGDAVSGVDSDKRDGPKRMVQSGGISQRAMGHAVIITSLLALIAGLSLIILAFPGNYVSISIFLLLGLAGIAAAIKYTVGKNPYGYVGLGDLFVFIFFGPVAVVGTFYLHVKEIFFLPFLPAISVGLFSIAVLNLNNIRDIESDKLSGKNSIPVRIGKAKASFYHASILMFGMTLPLIYIILQFTSWPQFLFILSYLLIAKNISAVLNKEAKELDPYLKQMALSTLLFSILFAVGHIL